MRALVIALMVAFVAATTLPTAAEARRIGGGSSLGMQRSLPPRAAPQAIPPRPEVPNTAAAPATAGAAAAAAQPRRSWMGPIAGLAAGLGLAALMSHFGLGAEFGSFLTMALLAGIAFFAIRFLMRRFAGTGGASGLQYAGAGAGAGFGAGPRAHAGNGLGGAAAASNAPFAATPAAILPATPAAVATLPAGFDAAAFERIAKMIFIRMQAANDVSDLNDLRNFTTPEMFAAIRLDLQERGAQPQRTDVVRVDAEVLDVASEAERQVVSVRFHGLIREDIDGSAHPFDEVWHLVKPADGSREWAIAGIQQATEASALAA